MAVRVRVQNLQSIEDATVVIDGLTVVTGPNNSGKTALMRAIRGVFVNAPAGPLVRHGCAHLTVSLTFDDGTEVVWEKGWSKPDRKGKTVNRYTINGQQLSGVGRGVPPEVESLGVREIPAASDRIWPQIAQQFDGTLFLVNRPGSAVAEALSDVERVGKLSSALKASEKDRRSVNSELKVRRKDLLTHEGRVKHYEGLDDVLAQGDDLQDRFRQSGLAAQEIQATEEIRNRYRTVRGRADTLASFDSSVVPDSGRSEKLCRGIERVGAYQARYKASLVEVENLRSFGGVTIPSPDSLLAQQEALRAQKALAVRHARVTEAASCYASFSFPSFDSTRPENLLRKREVVSDLASRRQTMAKRVEQVEGEATTATTDLAEAEAEVIRLLGERGVCPTCNTIHEGAHP
jgi:DNA repair exonuclease SbcCD ATPase subunit